MVNRDVKLNEIISKHMNIIDLRTGRSEMMSRSEMRDFKQKAKKRTYLKSLYDKNGLTSYLARLIIDLHCSGFDCKHCALSMHTPHHGPCGKIPMEPRALFKLVDRMLTISFLQKVDYGSKFYQPMLMTRMYMLSREGLTRDVRNMVRLAHSYFKFNKKPTKGDFMIRVSKEGTEYGFWYTGENNGTTN